MPTAPLEPDEIRVVRESLGLTQREAGELIGGGPNAFAKYETGTVAPSAAIVNLLLLLKADPGALGKLYPDRRSHPAVSRPLPFGVTSHHVATMSKLELQRCVRLLLHAEALAQGLPADGIHVTDNIDAPDGGEDARISWEERQERTPFLPGRLCLFQLKTGSIGPAAAGREMVTKTGEVKPMIRSALESGGHYIMLSTRPYTQQQIAAREEKMLDALLRAGLDIHGARVRFRDASQLAAWINAHPAVAHSLLESASPGLLGPFRSWHHWADRAEHDGSPWVEDRRLDEIGIFLRERVAIGQPRSVGRLVGLAEIGKSRLVLEALRRGVPGEGASEGLTSLVLYAVEGETGAEAIKGAVQNLADSGTRAIVVVDRCAPESHRVLARMVLRGTSQLSLITVDDEEPDTLRDETLRVEPAPPSVTEAIVNRLAPGLAAADQSRLVHFSQGFPGIAILVTQAWLDSLPVARATDEQLVDAYVLGRTPHDPGILLKSATLLATFGLVGIERPVDGQVARIARLGLDVTPDALRTGAKRLAERGVARWRGRYVSIEPRPIAMRLAERQWKDWSEDTWDEVLADSSTPTTFGDDPSLNVQAARQLKLLNTLGIARAVLTHVCRYGGPFDGLEGLLAPGHAEVLSQLAEIDTGIVAAQIERSLEDVEDLASIAGDARRHLVWALERIAFASQTFEEGASLLLRLAAAENEDWSNNATGQFLALFPLLLAGTEADGTQRLVLLDDLGATDDPTRRELVARALTAGLELDQFSRIAGPEAHGSRPALKEWRPKTHDEAYGYVRGCANRLVGLAVHPDQAGSLARGSLGTALGPLIRHGLIDVAELIVEQVGAAGAHWTEALTALESTLADPEILEDGALSDRIRALAQLVQPKSLEARVHFSVTDMPWDHLAAAGQNYEKQRQRQVEEVRELAAEAVQQTETLKALLPQLSRGQQRMTDAFGEAIARLARPANYWLEPMIRAIEEAPQEERNYGLLVGYVIGIADTEPDVVESLKWRAVESSVLAPTLPLMCSTLGVSPIDVGLVIAALQSGHLSPRWLTWGTIGSGLTDVPPPVAIPLFDAMLDHSGEAFAGALDLMGLYVHRDRDRLDALRPQVRKIAENALRWPWASQPHGNTAMHQFEEILTWMLERGAADEDASATAFTLARAVANVADYDGTRVIERVLPSLLSNFPGVSWPLIGSAIVSAEPVRAFLLQSLLGGGVRWGRGEYTAPILRLPEDALIAWCHAHPERAPAFAARVVGFLKAREGDGRELVVHPVLVRLIAEFGDRKDVTEAAMSNMSTGGWWGPEEGYWSTYQEPITQLLDHPHPNVRRWAKATLRSLRAIIEDARVRDAEEEALSGD